MNKSKNTILALGLSLLGINAWGQANSVKLKDGSNTIVGSYNSITNAYAAIPSTLTQAYTIEIDSSYHQTNETYPITFVSKTGASSSNTITVKLADNVSVKPIGVPNQNNPFFVFDDADWMIIDGTSAQNPGYQSLRLNAINTTANYPIIIFKNGASHNVVNNCSFINRSNGQGIFFGESPANNSGNSFNTISNCVFRETYYPITSEGTIANPNSNLNIHGNNFEVYWTGISLLAGTGKTTIDSNQLYNTNSDSLSSKGVYVEEQRDSTLITRNTMLLLSNGMGLEGSAGISVSSAANGNSYTAVINNILYTEAGNDFPQEMMTGIEFTGSNKIVADVYNNTVLFQDSLVNPINPPLVGSAAFYKSESNVNSVYNIRNNLFINKRSGPYANAGHVAIALMNTNGTLNMDYNTYGTKAGKMATIGSSFYPTFSAFRAALAPGNEVNGNDVNVTFNGEDAHLGINDWNNPGLVGYFIPGVDKDIEGETRAYPYRGADEYVTDCSGVNNLAITVSDTLVCGKTIFLKANTTKKAGVVYQWQQRPAGSTTAFTNIANGTLTQLYTSVTQATEFRLWDSCAISNDTGVSNVVTVNVVNPVHIDSISYTGNNGTYTFNAHGSLDSVSYIWYFGDGQGTSQSIPTHTYDTNGTYTVLLIAQNRCSNDSATIQLYIDELGVGKVSGLSKLVTIFPNPAKNSFTLRNSGHLSIIEVKLINTLGQTVKTINGIDAEEISMDINGLAIGYYLVNIRTDKGAIHIPLQKE